MFDNEGNMHMISGEGDIKFDSFTRRFFDDIGPGSLKQDPVTGDMWFDNGNFMECPFTIQKVTHNPKKHYRSAVIFLLFGNKKL